MMKSMNDALGNTKPFTSVSVWIDRLSSNAYAEDELDGIPELVEAINIQATGPLEASRALRKKLKYGSVHGQKRAITMLGALVENCGPRYQTTFADERLVERIKIMSQDPLVDASVRKKLMKTLSWWSVQFRNEPTMRLVAGLYAACGGGRKSEAQIKSEAAEAYRKKAEQEDRERQIRMDQKAAERLQKEEDKRREKERRKGGNKAKRPAFDFEKEKPQLLSSLATSQQAATSLVNALQHVNREKETVQSNERVQTYLGRVKTERKKLVRYIQLVRDEEFLGGLISANDQIILSLELYDRLSKSATADSDDEDNEPLAAIADKKSAAERAQARAEAEEAEIELVQKRLAAAHFEEGQLEALQDRQRIRIERHNSYRSERAAAGPISSTSAGAPRPAVQDLMDLNFDDDDGYGQAKTSSRAGPGPSSRRASQGGQNASLSDYSDYDSDSDEEQPHQPSQKQPGLQTGPQLGTGKDVDEEEEQTWTHKPHIGPSSLYDYGGEGDDDEGADPFADPDEDEDATLGTGFAKNTGARKEFAAV